MRKECVASLLVVGMLVGQRASAQKRLPAFELRGHRLGESLPDSSSTLDCTGGSVPDERMCTEFGTPIGEASVDLSYSYLHGRLYHVLLTYKQRDFDALTIVLRARYGAPSVRIEPFHTIGGVRTQNPIYGWRFREGTLEVRRYGNSITDGYGSIVTASGLKEYSQLRNVAARAAARRDLAPPAKKSVSKDETADRPTETPTRNANAGQPFFAFQVERQAELQSDSPRPEYPESLRARNIRGEVIAQFIVDATGTYERDSFKVMRSSDPLFTEAVIQALPTMYFRPAEIGDRKVKQLVQMPFSFTP